NLFVALYGIYPLRHTTTRFGYIRQRKRRVTFKGINIGMEEVSNRVVVVKTHVDDFPKETDFEVISQVLCLSAAAGELVVKNLYVSVDPYQLNRMKSQSSSQGKSNFSEGILLGEAVDTYGIGKVVASGDPEFNKGDLVAGLLTWADYCVLKPGGIYRKLDTMGFPLSNHVGALAFSGLTAYAGLFEVGKVKKGEKVFVSTASGSVGHLVGQFAKLHGCYVVGSAGSKPKVDLLKEKLGFDDAFNYKDETDLKATLKKYFPEGIDVYFDNVGGEMLEAAVENMNTFGRVAVCGVISEYTGKGKKAAPDMLDVIYKRITIQGFLAGDYMNVFPDFISLASQHMRSGKMVSVEDISIGLDNIPSAFVSLFTGGNVGKKIVQIAQD
ncbi:2-alkenal reductase (NADP(+)-dependent), partial [Linum grandiflorum]